MLNRRKCQARNKRDRPCGAPALVEGDRCFWHDPATQEAAAEARRLGGLRRRREGAIQGAYDLTEGKPDGELERVSELALMDLLELDNSIARSRVLIQWLSMRLRLREQTEYDARLRALEAGVWREAPDVEPPLLAPRIVVWHPDGRVEELQRDDPREGS